MTNLPSTRSRRATPRGCAILLLASVLSSALAEEKSLKDETKQAGHATGSAIHDVGHGAKQAGKEVAQAPKKVGKAVGHAAKEGVNAVKEGGRELKNAIKGDR